MEIISSDTPAITAANYLNQCLNENTSRPVLLMLSGGSALTILEHIDISLLSPRVTITTLDERFSTDSAVNNFAQIKATNFFPHAIAQGIETISTIVKDSETLEEAGERFTTALHHWKNTHLDSVVIATMGVGSDGHTAGIFPHQPNFDYETADWVVSYEIPPEVNPYTKRITVTPAFLKTQITQVIGLITGAEKREVLNKLQDSDCSCNKVPACLMRDMQSVVIVTDSK